MAAGAGEVGTIKSVAVQAVAASSEYATTGLASLRVATIAPAISAAAVSMPYSLATCRELLATRVSTNVVFFGSLGDVGKRGGRIRWGRSVDFGGTASNFVKFL